MLSSTHIKYGALGVFALLTLGIVFGSFYFVPEGHVGVERRFQKAVNQTSPGLNWKIPFVDDVVEIEVRERKSSETLNAATSNQLAVRAIVSINWTVNKENAIDLYRDYGSLQQFEDRVLDPRLRSAAKTALAHFTAETLIKERLKAINEIGDELRARTAGLPITINSPQIEELVFPPKYVASIQAKEQAYQDNIREDHVLDKQKKIAQQKVNTADAERDAAKSKADGEKYALKIVAEGQAYSTLERAKAEAEAIKLINRQIVKNPRYVEFIKAKRWNGQLPTTVLGDSANVLMTLNASRN